MKNKNIFMSRLIYSVFLVVFLLYIFIKNLNFTTRIIIIPFFICSLAILGKNVALIKNKERSVNFLINYML